MKTTALIAVAGMAAVASAQTMTISWTVSDTGNGDGIIEPGESALLTMSADMNPGGDGFAGSIYDIIGTGNFDTGSVDSNVNHLNELTDDGQLQGNNDILLVESFQLPRAFNGNFDDSNPIDLYSITWTPSDYSARNVSGITRHVNFSVYTDSFGTSVEYTGDVSGFSFDVVPAPASMALLGLGGLVAGRRRR
ncbi:MAG: PEP-CTERM sorting domain-containing protein [Planctomycetota bacterium]|nr:MAG: PEP-CTERM sorting domain-containing protein [Planctomycetota bacterium]